MLPATKLPKNRIIVNNLRWLASYYGSRRGLVLTLWHRFLYMLGAYRDYSQVDWQSIERLVFICKGNICRSVYAEVIATSSGLSSISCGVSTRDNVPANEDAVRVADSRGVSLKEHRTSRLQSIALRPTDLLIAMEPWQADYLLNHLPAGVVCTLLGLWEAPVTPHIHDPYGSSSHYFDKCFECIEKSVYEIAGKVR